MSKSKIFLKEETVFPVLNGKDFYFPVIIVDVNGKETPAAFTWKMIQHAEKKYKQIQQKGKMNGFFQNEDR